MHRDRHRVVCPIGEPPRQTISDWSFMLIHTLILIGLVFFDGVSIEDAAEGGLGVLIKLDLCVGYLDSGIVSHLS